MKNILPFLLLLLFSFTDKVTAQIVLNEVSSVNTSFQDENGDFSDWIELYNTSSEPISLEGWSITDDNRRPQKTMLPSYLMTPKEHIVLTASDKENIAGNYYRSVLEVGDSCKYLLPNNIDTDWKAIRFDDSHWSKGVTSIGSDSIGDITMVAAESTVLFLRQDFHLDMLPFPLIAEFYVDYDDAFIAYINGIEIARSKNIIDDETNPSQKIITEEHEVQNGKVERYRKNISRVAVEGKNVLSIEVHSMETGTPDLSIHPYLLLSSAAPISNICNAPPPITKRKSPGIHTNFKLKATETLYLIDPIGQIQDSMYIPDLLPNLTIGRDLVDLKRDQLFAQRTPCKPNTSPTLLGFIDKPVKFSVTSGLYNTPIMLSLSGASEGEQIRYTLDGSDPSLSSPLFTEAIVINASTVVRANYFKDNFLSGSVSSQSYLFDVHHDLPVLSLTVNKKDFFDDTVGIYAPGLDFIWTEARTTANYYKDIEKPIQISYFDQATQGQFHSNAGVKIFGGSSRNKPQRSLSLFFRGLYGNASLEYPLFDNRNYSSYQNFVLRNNGNDEVSMIRDLTLTGLMENSHQDIQAGKPVVSYINGDYWGIYNIREKINEHFLASKHQVSIDSLTILEGLGGVVHGDAGGEYEMLIDYVENNDLSTEEHLKTVTEQIDVPNFLQYYVAQLYFGNTDWPNKNIKFWKPVNGKWRWILFDTDFGFGWYAEKFERVFDSYNTNNIKSLFENKILGYNRSPRLFVLFTKLMTNTSFRNRFINTAADELNTRFIADKVVHKLEKNADRILNEMPAHIERWNGQHISSWANKVDRMKEFAEKRPDAFRIHLQEQFALPTQREVEIGINEVDAGEVQLNSIRLTDSVWKGVYFESVPITLTAFPKPGYSFDRWSGSVESTSSSITVDPDEALAITAHFTRTDSELALRDVLFNEINYNSSAEQDAGDWVELYNNGPNKEDLSGWKFKDSDDEHTFLFPQGTSIEPDGYLVLTNNQDKFDQQFPFVRKVVGDFDFKLSSEGESIRLYDANNLLVDSLHYLPFNGWPTAANGEGPTLELIDPNKDNALPNHWSSFSFTGTPAAPNGIYTTAVQDFHKNPIITVEPNPVKDQISLMIAQSGTTDIQIRLLDMQGRIQEKLFSQKNYANEYLTLKIPPVPEGIYLLQIRLGTQQFIKKIIKQ